MGLLRILLYRIPNTGLSVGFTEQINVILANDTAEVELFFLSLLSERSIRDITRDLLSFRCQCFKAIKTR